MLAMTVTYKPKLRDYLWFAGHCCYRTARNSQLLVSAILLCCIIVALPLITSPSMAFGAMLGYMAMLVSATSTAAFLLILALGVCVRIQTGRSAFENQEVTFDDMGIVAGDRHCRLPILWKDVRALESGTFYLLVRFYDFAALIIPRRAFGDSESWFSFCSQCQQRLLKSQAGRQ
jgi:hypothetical protein